MVSLAGNMHLDPDMLLASYHHYAALGALVLFFAEGALITLFAIAWKKPCIGMDPIRAGE